MTQDRGLEPLASGRVREAWEPPRVLASEVRDTAFADSMVAPDHTSPGLVFDPS